MKKDDYYGEKFINEGDTMEVVLNVKEGTLKYIINGTDYGNAVDDIDQTARYRLAVTLRAKESVIELY